jgi:hypothetical protein
MTLVQKFSPARPLEAPKLCKKCVFYRPAPDGATCKLYGSIDLVDGKVAYFPAVAAREHYCKGEHYVAKKSKHQ